MQPSDVQRLVADLRNALTPVKFHLDEYGAKAAARGSEEHAESLVDALGGLGNALILLDLAAEKAGGEDLAEELAASIHRLRACSVGCGRNTVRDDGMCRECARRTEAAG